MRDALVLSRGSFDRLAERRADASWIAQERSSGRFLHLGPTGVWSREGAVEYSQPCVQHAELLLGSHAGITYFICLHSNDEQIDGHGAWSSLRNLGSDVDGDTAALLATATALSNWHLSHQHCVRCGSPTVSQEAGWSTRCESCSYTHFPRTDPAVIVLVRDDRDRALLARQRRWEAGWFSTLAGFVEAGESAEAAVVREVREEAGVILDESRVQYLASQPWPFPGSLMLGYHAWSLTTEVEPDGEEITEARWFTRDDLRAACETGEVLLPPRISIARALIEEWFGEALPGNWIRA